MTEGAEVVAASSPSAVPSVEQLAQHFHDTYESLAPSFGYETRAASAVSWAEVPEANRSLMVATVDAVAGLLMDELRWLRELRDLAAVHTSSVEGGDPRVTTESDIRMMQLLTEHGFHKQDFSRLVSSFFGSLG